MCGSRLLKSKLKQIAGASVGSCVMARNRTILSLLLIVFLLSTVDAQLKRKEDIPQALEEYMGRRIAYTMGVGGAPWLVRKNRQQEEDCATLLRELKLKPAMIVCDMGCGNGFYTLKMADMVGQNGTVLAVDIQAEMLRLLQARADEQQVKNVKPILSTLVDPKLPKEKVDLILCVDVYHEFSHPQQMLKGMRDSLSPTGVIALAEYREEDPEVPIKPLHKMSKEQILKEYSANGLTLVREFDGLPWQHLMFFGRSDSSDKKSTDTDHTSLP
jgi:ubiquinone/menaquinone biosynthesis C-methylase UbiE